MKLEKIVYGEQGFPAELKKYYIENYKIVEIESSRFDPRWKQFIAEQAEEFKNTTDINEYSLKIQQINQEFRNQINFFYTVEAYYDFENLRTLISRGAHYNYVISQQEQQGIDTAESMDELKHTFEYIKQLLNDLDVVINKNGKGDTFGLLYQLDGEHIKELEKFAWGEQGFSAELKDYYTQLIQKRE